MPIIIDNPKVSIVPNLLEELETFTADQGQVIIHGIVNGGSLGTAIRIWPTTYLFDRGSSHKSELVHYEKISAFPQWTDVPPYSNYTFTLVFSGLPEDCKVFDLKEIIPQNGGFVVAGIVRNRQDVYFLEF
ncbi:MAG: hypothetical protein LC107_14400 [Chitinophagales bacterium]|nr:hypothetical protein [Chitinophagales bacterium]